MPKLPNNQADDGGASDSRGIPTPSIFLSPKTVSEASIIRQVHSKYGTAGPTSGINCIDGLVIPLSRSPEIKSGLQLDDNNELVQPYRPIHDRVFIYDPELHKLFSGSEREKQNILQIGLSDSRRRNLLQAIRHNKEQKRGNLMRVVYPQLDLGFIQMIIEEQVVQNADILTCPTVPLTSKENFELQISKFTEMAQEGLAVTENLIRKELKRETMVVLTVQPRVVRPETTSTLVETLVSLGCRHIGIKPLDDPYKDSTNARALHNLIEQIRKQADPKTRIYFMNVLEAGYTAFAFGADVVTMTTGYPYFVPPDEERKNGRESYGRWYNPKAMLWVERTEALEASRTHNYLIPCSCGASQEVRTFLSVDKAPDWNRYRKAHYCLVKNDEARMLQNAEVPLRHAIREMFARSENVMPIALIP